MVERVLEITRTSPIERYGKHNYQNGEDSRKRNDSSFKDILNQKMQQDIKITPVNAYKLDIKSLNYL